MAADGCKLGTFPVHVRVAARPGRQKEAEARADVHGPEGSEGTDLGDERGREKQRTLEGKMEETEGNQCAALLRPPPPLPVLAAPPVRPFPHTAPGAGHAVRALGRARVCRSAARRVVEAVAQGDGVLLRGRPVRGCGEAARGRGGCYSPLVSSWLSAGGDVAPARPGRQGHRGGCPISAARSGRDARWVAGAGGHRQRGAASHQSGITGAVEPPRPFTWKRPCAPPQPTEGKSAPVRFRGQIGDSQSSTGRGGEQGGGGWWERGGGTAAAVGQWDGPRGHGPMGKKPG